MYLEKNKKKSCLYILLYRCALKIDVEKRVHAVTKMGAI